MKMVMKNISISYPGFAAITFLIEIMIALFIHDNFIRPYMGDVLVVILIYCFLKSFFDVPVLPAALLVLGFSFFVEFLQYVNIVEKLRLGNSKFARIVIGTSFSWMDMLAYWGGFMLVLIVEKHLLKKALFAASGIR